MRSFILASVCLLLLASNAYAGVAFPSSGTSSAILDANSNVNFKNLGNAILPQDRDPLPTDDTTQGYAVNDNWVNAKRGTAWQAQRVTAGAAVWQQVILPNLPIIDAVGATAVAGYGVTLLKQSYAGNSMQLTRASDSTTQNVGFVNGTADWQAVDSFCNSTTCYVTIWYDQVGTNHLTQTAGVNAPVITTYQLAGFKRGITFSNLDATSSANIQYLSNAGFAGFAPNNYDVFTIAAPLSSASKNMYWCVCSGSTINMWMYSSNGSTLPFLTSSGNGAGFTSTIIPPAAPMPTVFEGYSSGTGKAMTANDVIQTAAATGTSTVFTGLAVGGATGNYTYALTGTLYGVVIYTSGLTTAQRTTFRQLAYQTFGIVPQLRANMIVVGDSITAGYKTPPISANYAAIAWSKYTQRFRTYVMAIVGVTGTNISTYLSSWYPSGVSSGQNNVCIEYTGTNDVTGSASAATVYATKNSITSFLSSNGCTKTYSATMLPRQNTGNQTTITAINSLMYATTPTGAAGLVDFGGDPTMGAQANLTNTSLWNADQVHPTFAGQHYLASILLNTLSTSNIVQ